MTMSLVLLNPIFQLKYFPVINEMYSDVKKRQGWTHRMQYSPQNAGWELYWLCVLCVYGEAREDTCISFRDSWFHPEKRQCYNDMEVIFIRLNYYSFWTLQQSVSLQAICTRGSTRHWVTIKSSNHPSMWYKTIVKNSRWPAQAQMDIYHRAPKKGILANFIYTSSSHYTWPCIKFADPCFILNGKSIGFSIWLQAIIVL